MVYGAFGRISYRPDGQHVTVYLDAKLPQKDHAQRAHRYSRGSFARTGTLDHVANIIMSIFDTASTIGMSGPRQRHGLHFFLDRRDAHLDLPVLPVAILDFQGDGRTKRQSV